MDTIYAIDGIDAMDIVDSIDGIDALDTEDSIDGIDAIAAAALTGRLPLSVLYVQRHCDCAQ
jgi:hypothetical protein